MKARRNRTMQRRKKLAVNKLFPVTYERPRIFSNPFDHFSNIRLKKIINKNDQDMGWSDYSVIFHPTPIGTYPELCYFLPFALQYLQANPDKGLNCSEEVIQFISETSNNLKKDGLWDNCLHALSSCLNDWIKEFNVIHFNQAACREKGWNLDHDDIIVNSQIVIESLETILDCQLLAHIASDFIERIRTSGTPLESAWYLELSGEIKRYHLAKNPKLKNLLSDRKCLEKCLAVVKESSFIDATSSPTYWDDVFSRLELV